MLTAPVDGDVTYVCRVSNRAGSDADIVSIRTGELPQKYPHYLKSNFFCLRSY